MSGGGVLEFDSCQKSTAIILTHSCICVMRFLAFLTDLDTAEHRVYSHPCIEHDRRIQKAEYSGRCLCTARACPRLLHHAISCLYAHSFWVQFRVLELHVGDKSDKLFLRGKIPPSSSEFSLPLFFFFFLRSVMIMVYLTDTP